MPWVKLDDALHRHRKVRRAWALHPRALGLHLLALSYCGEAFSDGFVDPEWLAMQHPPGAPPGELAAAVRGLVDAGLWREFGDGWEIHDWLDFNPSQADVERVQEARRLAGQAGARARWQNRQNGRNGDAG